MTTYDPKAKRLLRESEERALMRHDTAANARLNYVAQRVAPHIAVTSIVATPSENILTLACGHVLSYAAHFDCSKTREARCFECGLAKAKALPEFAVQS
jgi:hypothetical protein